MSILQFFTLAQQP